MYSLNKRSEDKTFFEVLIFIVASFWAFMFLGIFVIAGLFIFMTANTQTVQAFVPTPVVEATPVVAETSKSVPYQIGEEIGATIFDGAFFATLEEFDVSTAVDEALLNAAAFFIVRGDSVAKLVESGGAHSERVISVCVELFGELANRSTKEDVRQELYGLSVSCANRNPLGIRGYSALLKGRLDGQ